MSLAIFGITNNGLNLVATLFLLMLVVLWLALIVYTYLDARRRISDPFLVACATVASFFPFIGTAVYAIVRPPEFLEDAHERELEIKAAELRVRQLSEQSCPNCEYPVERNYLRCPNCQQPAQGSLPDLQKTGRPALGPLPLLRDEPAAAASGRAAETERPRGARSASGTPAGTPRQQRRAAPGQAPRPPQKAPPAGADERRTTNPRAKEPPP